MPPKQLTFVDSSVLINAIVGSDAARVMPIPTKYNRKREATFYERFFKGVSSWVNPASIIRPAFDLACLHGLGAMDALHLAAAIKVGAEFVSAERPTKPIYSAYANAFTIY